MSENTINLNWTNNATNGTGVVIQRGDSLYDYSELATVSSSTTSYSDTTGTPGTTYYYRVYTTALVGDSLPSAETSATTNINAPSGLSATPDGENENLISLSWTNNSANTTFNLQRSLDGTNWTTIATPTGTSYSDTGVIGGTEYFYRVQTAGTSVNSSWSNTASATTVLDAPTDLTATDNGEVRIDLAWVNNSSDEAGFKVEKSPDGSSWTVLATLGAVTSYSDTGLTGLAHWYYRVRCFKGSIYSAYSDTANTSTTFPAPSGLAATDNGETEVDLVWTINSTTQTSFDLQRSLDGGTTWTNLANPSPTATSYRDTGLTGLETYTYKIRAVNGNGDTAYTSTTSASTTFPAPSGLAITSTETSFSISWSLNSSTQAAVLLERSSDGSSYTQIQSLSSTATSFDDTGFLGGDQRWYRVRVSNTNGNSAYCTPLSSTTPFPAPSGLTATDNGENEIDLAWTINSVSQSHILVERSLDGVTYSQIDSASSSATSYSDTSVSGATQYWYRVKASNADTSSAYSNMATATTILTAPSGLSATGGNDQIALHWTNHSTAATNVSIESSPDGSTWTALTTVSNSTTAYTQTGLAEVVTNYYRIRCYKGSIYSTYSSTANATTILIPPSGLTAGQTDESHVSLNWTVNSAAATGQNIQRSTDNATWTTVTSVSAATHTYTDNFAFLADTTYYYRIQAVDGGTTANGNTASIMLVPNAPTDLTLGSYTLSSIDLSWTNNSSIETGFLLQQSDYFGSGYTTAGTSTTDSKDLTGSWGEGEVLYMRVAATTTNKVSSYCTPVEITMAPAAPTDLAEMQNSAGNIIYSWQNNSAHDDTYHLKWSSSYYATSYNYVTLSPDTTPGDTMNYTGLGPTTTPEGQTFSVWVWCSENSVNSTVDGPVTALSAPYAPTGLSAALDSAFNPSLVVKLSWTNVSTVATGVTVYQSLVGNSDFSNPIGSASAAPGAMTFTDTGNSYAPGTTAYYMIRAVGTSYSAAASTSISM